MGISGGLTAKQVTTTRGGIRVFSVNDTGRRWLAGRFHHTYEPKCKRMDLSHEKKEKQDKTRHFKPGDKTRQDRTTHDKTVFLYYSNPLYYRTGHDMSRHDKTEQDKTRQDKTRQDKTSQDNTRLNKTRQDKTRQDKTHGRENYVIHETKQTTRQNKTKRKYC